MREQGGGGPSAMGLYASHSGQADLGHRTAAELAAYQMQQQQQFAQPLAGSDFTLPANSRMNWLNTRGMEPAKYDLPNFRKERFQAREALRKAVPANSNVQRTDPITDEEVDYIQAMKRQAELADFDRYVNTLVDPLKPGNLKWLMEVYPEFVHRRIAQVHDDYDFAIRSQMIDTWGINTLDDLHFKYLVDQGKISGAKLGKRKPLDDEYQVGILAPYSNKNLAGDFSDRSSGLRLPYASTPGNESLLQANAGQPLGEGSRGYQSLATDFYRAGPTS